MKTTDEILNELKSLNLSEYPVDKIKSLIKALGIFGQIKITLHEGKEIFRARPNNKGENFSKISDLSYVPSDRNKYYKRASTPNTTMFYGSLLPEGIETNDFAEARVICGFECIPFLRNKSLDGEQEITFGKWIVTDDITLLAIAHHKDFTSKKEYIEGMRANFEKFVKENPELEEKTIKILEYFSSEFAKESTDNEYDYLISALYTEIALSLGLDGVLYPSVRAAGEGFNVAIHPSVVDSSMVLESVGVCTFYKKGHKTAVDNETFAFIEEGKEIFTLNKVDSKYHAGREKMLEIINS